MPSKPKDFDSYRQRVRRMRHAITVAIADMDKCGNRGHHHEAKRLLIAALRQDKAIARLHKLGSVPDAD